MGKGRTFATRAYVVCDVRGVAVTVLLLRLCYLLLDALVEVYEDTILFRHSGSNVGVAALSVV